MSSYEKRGYLNCEFKLFHLSDIPHQEFEFHYHDFDKIIIFLKGSVDYIIEGKSYPLRPYDIILVNHNDIHRPIIDLTVPYERIIVYLSPGFIDSYQTEDYDLSQCFQRANKAHTHVLRMQSMEMSGLYRSIQNLEKATSRDGYANELYCQVLFLEFMIHLNRASLNHRLDFLQTGQANQKVLGIMDYINENLTSELNIDHLASRFYLSKYHMMRLFKQETGYTIGTYISQKRLMLAKELLAKDIPITQICFDCGFKNYSTFSRAYKEFFGETPKAGRGVEGG